MTQTTRSRRRALTLVELLVGITITTMVVAALGVFTRAVMDGYQQTNKTGSAAQSARVVLSRIGHAVATSRQVLKAPPGVRWPESLDHCLLVWERDGGTNDPTPGQPNWAEVVIYARSRKNDASLWELRPKVDSSVVVPLNDPDLVANWICRFRDGQDVVLPTVVLLNNAGGIHFEVVEYTDPQGVAGLVQQDVRVRLCVRPNGEQPMAFFGSATRRYVPGSSNSNTSVLYSSPIGDTVSVSPSAL